jgi:hypothetical protein
VLRTRSPLDQPRIATQLIPFDLHVLSTPPAFVLSQNQTLQIFIGAGFIQASQIDPVLFRTVCTVALATCSAQFSLCFFVKLFQPPSQAGFPNSGFSERSFAEIHQIKPLFSALHSVVSAAPVSVADEKTSSPPNSRNRFFALFTTFPAKATPGHCPIGLMGPLDPMPKSQKSPQTSQPTA